jgi:hypothetical protein
MTIALSLIASAPNVLDLFTNHNGVANADAGTITPAAQTSSSAIDIALLFCINFDNSFCLGIMRGVIFYAKALSFKV